MTLPPLRFCMVTTFYPPYNYGGDGIFVERLANELAARGHTVDVIHCVDAYKLGAGRLPAAGDDDRPAVTVHGLRSRWGALSPLATQQTGHPCFKAARLRAVLAQGFDVIHFHNVSLVGGPGVLRYGSGVKLYTLHEYWLVCPTHVLFKYRRRACEAPSCLRCSLVYRRPPQAWRYLGLVKRAVKHVDAFLAPSRFVARRHAQLGIPIVHVPHFIPPAPAEETAGAAGGNGRPYFLFVGRLEKLKGLQTLIPVFRRYPRATLRVAGTGGFEAALRRQAAGTANIEFLGRQPGRRLRALYRQAVAVIVPSICLETFSLVTVEAFRAGTPAIVRNLGGLPEIIEESGGGHVYETEEELVAAMDRFLDDPAHRADLGARGRAAYERCWTPDAHLERYFALIEELRQKKASGGPAVSGSTS